MARPGRKRRADAMRHPCGQVIRETRSQIRAIALAQPHRAGYPASKREDARLESELGRLAVDGEHCGGISDSEYRAGERYKKAVSDYRRAICAPRGTPLSRNAMMIPTGPDMSETPMDEDAVRRAKEVYDGAIHALSGDRRAWHAVDAVAITNIPLRFAVGGIDDLRRGLRRLEKYFGLDR